MGMMGRMMEIRPSDELRKKRNEDSPVHRSRRSVESRRVYHSNRKDLKWTLPCSLNARGRDGDIKKEGQMTFGLERGSIAAGEPWKRRTECVVRFPTLFPFISLSKSHFSLCAKMRSDLLPSLGLARLPHGVFLQFGRSARFRRLKRIYIYTHNIISSVVRNKTHTAKVLESFWAR